MEIYLAGHFFQYQIDYTKKNKNVLVRLTDSSTIQVKAPKGYPLPKITAILEKKARWILTHSQRIAALEKNPLNQEVADGAKVLYLGEEHTLRFHNQATTNEVKLTSPYIDLYFAAVEPQPAEILLRNYMIEAAKQRLAELTKKWATMIEVYPKRLYIKEQKTRWGSCSSLGSISYNWRIIMAPPSVIEYLVIHELSHMLEPNHSARFWSVVQSFDPLYREHRLWLNNHSLLVKRLFAKQENQ